MTAQEARGRCALSRRPYENFLTSAVRGLQGLQVGGPRCNSRYALAIKVQSFPLDH